MTIDKDDEANRREYLKKHVGYEWRMLRHTFRALHQSTGDDWNMAYESFCVHARNLYLFLRNNAKKETNFRACDFTSSYEPPKHSDAFKPLDDFIFHMDTERLVLNGITMGIIREELAPWLDGAGTKWSAALEREGTYKGILDRTALSEPKIEMTNGVTKATACTASTTPQPTGQSAVQVKIIK